LCGGSHDPSVRECGRLFQEPTPHVVGGVARDDPDLWFLEYRPKTLET